MSIQYKKYISFFIIVVILFSISTIKYGKVAEAQLVIFTPELCSGGWNNAQLAAGVSDLNGIYTPSNSAVLEGKSATLYCKNFSGALPPQTKHTRVMVRFSWTQIGAFAAPISSSEAVALPDAVPGTADRITDGTHIEQGAEDISGQGDEMSETDPSATSTELIIDEKTDLSATSTDSVGDIGVGVDSDTTLIEQSDDVLPPADDVREEVPELIPSNAEPVGDDVSEDTSPSDASESTSLPTPTETIAPEEATPLSLFWSLFVPSVYAEENMATTTPAILNSDISSTTPSIPDTDAGSEASQLVEETSSFSTSDTAIFSVGYTLDGTTWQTIGHVAAISNDIRFEIPASAIATLADIELLQIALFPLPTFDTVAPIYLDSLYLEVTYSPMGELGVHHLADPQPEQYDYGEYIAYLDSKEEVATSSDFSTASSVVTLMENFAERITFVKGITADQILVSVTTASSSEWWLLHTTTQRLTRIGSDEAAPYQAQVGVKDQMVFWLNEAQNRVYIYDQRAAGVLRYMLLVGNLPADPEHRLTFPFTQWEVVWRDNAFYFYTFEHGEVFSDEDTSGLASFAEEFSLATQLSDDQLHLIGLGAIVAVDNTDI